MKGVVSCFLWLSIWLALGCIGPQRASKSKTADFHVKLAANYYVEGNLAMAQKEIYQALRMDPKSPEAHHVEGFILLGLKQYVQAAVAFRKALQLKPDYFEARNNLGAALIAQGRYRDAIEVLKPLTREPLYATPSHAHGNIGLCYMRLHQWSKAREHLERAVFLNPKFCKGYDLLGQTYEKLGDLESAVRAWQKAAEICEWYAEPHYHLGRVAEMGHDLARARKEFQRCAELARDSVLGRRCGSRL